MMGLFGGTDQMNPLNLKKGDILDLTKSNSTLKNIIVGCGWKINDRNGDNYDLDISAFMLDKDGKVKDPSSQVVFFNAMTQRGIYLEGDNLVGTNDDSDAERIHITLDDVPSDIERIIFNVNIFEANERKQTFGMVKKSYIRLLDVDKNEAEICKFELRENAASSTAVIFAELFRQGNGWSFKALGQTLVVKDLNQLLLRYM